MAELEEVYERFMRREIHVPGKDFCDMSKPFETPFEEYSIINCMLPTKYVFWHNLAPVQLPLSSPVPQTA